MNRFTQESVWNEAEKRKHQALMNQEEKFSENHSGVDEEMMRELLVHGTLEQIRTVFESGMLRYPELIKGDRKRSEEYMAIALVTLLTRIAVEEGVSSRHAFLMSDVYLELLSECRTADDILTVRNTASLDFQIVIQSHQSEKSNNRYVEDCKRFVRQNLHEKILLKDLAHDLGLTSNYLSSLFFQVEGVRFTDYVKKSKMEMAKDLLAHSTRTIGEISTYLSFSSQSYFCNRFKDSVGMTPNEYRNKHYSPEY